MKISYHNRNSSVESAATIAEKVAFLEQPRAYPHPVTNVEVKETHMSWVFLAGDLVYKLKKPVVYRFLDFRLLEARFENCREEVRLNQRLAGDIYVGIEPLVLNKDGQMQVGGKGQVIEWMVKMKRIREEDLLDYAIKHQKAEEKLVNGAAELLAHFYLNSPPVPIEPGLHLKKLKSEIISTYTELLNPLYHFPQGLIETICNNLTGFLGNHSSLFENRIANGKIIDAHGDLRPEHICLAPQPAIIDALEFKKELRIMDIAEELSFLGMECEMIGDPAPGKLFFDRYQKIKKDIIPETLICFYKSKRAFLRAYLVARHILEIGYKDDPKWLKRANDYLLLSEKYNNKLPA